MYPCHFYYFISRISYYRKIANINIYAAGAADTAWFGDKRQPSSAIPPALGNQQESAEGHVLHINTTLVTVPVSVMDRNGKYVPNLQQKDFRVYEDGIEQEIAYFVPVETPFTVALLLDTSGSTFLRLEDIQAAAIAFVNQLRTVDQVLIISFDSGIHKLADTTNDREKLYKAIRRTRTGTSTRLYDAVNWVINKHLRFIPGRKAIILLTDGVDTASRKDMDKRNLRDVEELDALIYAVQYSTYEHLRIYQEIMKTMGSKVTVRGSTPEDFTRADAYLSELVEKSGGRRYRADSIENITEVFGLVAEELRRQYTLGYYPKTPVQDGQQRQIKVRVSSPDLVVRARTSYIAYASANSSDRPGQRKPTPVLRRQ